MDIVARIARVEEILIEMGYGNRIEAQGASELPTSVTAMVSALNAVDAAVNSPSVPNEPELPFPTPTQVSEAVAPAFKTFVDTVTPAEPTTVTPVEPAAEVKEPA